MMGQVGVALLLDWTFMASGHHGEPRARSSDLTGGACLGPLSMLGGATTTATELAAEIASRERTSTRVVGEREENGRKFLLGSLDVFVASRAQHHNLLHYHRQFCDGMVSVAMQLEGRKAWWVYPFGAMVELGPPRAQSS
mmetsp:Transcript_15984/g.42073  ORF Transcript_15984/g.42073 Transcript_15984/m.42073 type:complete len:140 (-) Transcript_15984:176-595(-)